MSTLTAQRTAVDAQDTAPAALRRAQAALCLGAAAAILLAVVTLFITTSPGQGKFHHAGDYVLTGDGIPYMLALLTLLPSLRALQRRRDGRLGQAGIVLASLGAVVLLGIFAYGLIAATSSSIGPAYALAAFATIIGVALFAAGSWRAGLLPRWLLALWMIAWLLGSSLPIVGPGPLLLAATFLIMAITLSRHLMGQENGG